MEQVACNDDLFMRNRAVFSPDRLYRYTLERIWEGAIPPAMFIGLNPSTADESQDDPTVRRCIRFARDWECGGLVMMNLFAYRATNPRDMLAVEDPEGTANIFWLLRMARRAGIIIAAWGIWGAHLDQGEKTLEMLRLHGLGDKIHHLGLTLGNQPRHPLYIPAAVRPIKF